jgi:hypothetical protein
MTRRPKLTLSPEQELRKEPPAGFPPAPDRPRPASETQPKPPPIPPDAGATFASHREQRPEDVPRPRVPRLAGADGGERESGRWLNVGNVAKVLLLVGAAALSVVLLVRRGF